MLKVRVTRHPATSVPRHVRQRLLPIAAMEFTATAVVIADLWQAQTVRHGHKWLWFLLAFVQPIGPWLYFLFGQAHD